MLKNDIKKFFKYVCEDVALLKNISIEDAEIIVRKSYFPKALGTANWYVMNYDAIYWAKKIIDFN